MDKDYNQMMAINYDRIVEAMKIADDEMEKYNGWSNSNSALSKEKIYQNISLKASYDLYYDLDFEKYFTEEYTEKLFKILNKWPHYDFFQYLFDSTLDDSEITGKPMLVVSLNDVKERIDDTLDRISFLDNSTYQAFYFRDSIKEIYYQGDTYLGADNLSVEDRMDMVLEICKVGLKEDFFPKLIEDIHNLFGDENVEYDMYEFGSKGFMLYWSVANDVYYEKMELIKQWAKYNQLEQYMFFSIKKIQEKKPTEQKFVEEFGHPEIVKEYYNN